MIEFGIRLKKQLHEMGLSQSEFGRRIGTTSQSVNGWCLSGTLPRHDVLNKISEMTGKPLYWFFMSENEEKELMNTIKLYFRNNILQHSDHPKEIRISPSIQKDFSLRVLNSRLSNDEIY
ncbi:helix-turn-helix transcriptional regulator [Enterobacter sp. ECC-175]|uniref:helix-turn-helix transcriptional regulator n=1 Tax=unclassified Enterobacter TaxID=2608935 RepID=UPI000D49210E|nr:helix-turn-helix transcriptional regulator [Enterobacter sp. RIT 418]RAU36470.1 hypothetical protein DBY73_008390 [Enterobacter sp. RIT 418]